MAHGYVSAMAACPVCDGTGFLLKESCPLCDGEALHSDDDGQATTASESFAEVGNCSDPSGESGHEVDVDADVDDAMALSTILGELDVSFLSGQTVTVQVHKGESMASVKAHVFHNRHVGKGLRPQLLHPTGVIQDDESAADYLGVPLTALFTRLDLSDEARLMLRRCTMRAPEDGQIDLLEMRFRLTMDDINPLVELLMQCQPRRLILTAALNEMTLGGLARNLKAKLEVETLHLPVTRQGVKDAATVVRLCPCLECCYFHEGNLRREDVKDLRDEVTASIVI